MGKDYSPTWSFHAAVIPFRKTVGGILFCVLQGVHFQMYCNTSQPEIYLAPSEIFM